MTISAAANLAPEGGLGGVMETEAMMDELAVGAKGRGWTVSVDESSCSVKSRSPGEGRVGSRL